MSAGMARHSSRMRRNASIRVRVSTRGVPEQKRTQHNTNKTPREHRAEKRRENTSKQIKKKKMMIMFEKKKKSRGKKKDKKEKR